MVKGFAYSGAEEFFGDPDLEWIDEQIRRVEDGGNYFAMQDPARMEQRNEYLRRLRRVRSRLLGEEPK